MRLAWPLFGARAGRDVGRLPLRKAARKELLRDYRGRDSSPTDQRTIVQIVEDALMAEVKEVLGTRAVQE